MKRAVVTICCGDFFERLAAITHPTIEAYARRLHADFIVWRQFTGHAMPHYQKLELGKLLDRYDRVLYLDTDVLVRDDAPDLFELVPEDKLGMLVESDYVDRTVDVIQYMIAMNYDARNWDRKYYNAGVVVLSQPHRNLFVQPDVEADHIKEQTYLNLMISRTKTKVFPLPYRFNRMVFMDWLYGEHRCDSYLIHYSGVNLTSDDDAFLNMAAGDRATWERARPLYRFPKHLAYVVLGDVGEQVAAEPAIRYAREVLHKDEHLVVASRYPRVFRHLGLPVYEELTRVPDVNRYLPRYNRPTPAQPPLAVDPQGLHTISLASLNLLGIELPQAYRRPKLDVDPAARASLAAKLEPHRPADLIVVHANRDCATGRANTDDWVSYARTLAEGGLPVTAVGDRREGDFASADWNAAGCLDLLDRLSPDEMIALAAAAPVVLTSEADLLQIAAAFDGWIGLIGANRHPDYLLPWRNGSQSWRATDLGRRPDAASVLEFVRTALADRTH